MIEMDGKKGMESNEEHIYEHNDDIQHDGEDNNGESLTLEEELQREDCLHSEKLDVLTGK